MNKLSNYSCPEEYSFNHLGPVMLKILFQAQVVVVVVLQARLTEPEGCRFNVLYKPLFARNYSSL